MSKTNRNHYNPRNYLRAWTATTEQIYQLDLRAEAPQPKLVGVGDAGVERFLYPQVVEDYLRDYVEGPAWDILARLKLGEQVLLAELEPLYKYMAAQIGRTPAMRDALRNRLDIVRGKVHQEWARNGMGLSHDESDEQFINDGLEWAIDRATTGQSPTLVNLMRQMTWKVYQLNDSEELITSDCGVYRIGERLTDMDAGIFFPVSPDRVLVGLRNTNERWTMVNEIMVPKSAVEVERAFDGYAAKANSLIAGHADRFIFGRSEVVLLEATRATG